MLFRSLDEDEEDASLEEEDDSDSDDDEEEDDDEEDDDEEDDDEEDDESSEADDTDEERSIDTTVVASMFDVESAVFCLWAICRLRSSKAFIAAAAPPPAALGADKGIIERPGRADAPVGGLGKSSSSSSCASRRCFFLAGLSMAISLFIRAAILAA